MNSIQQVDRSSLLVLCYTCMFDMRGKATAFALLKSSIKAVPQESKLFQAWTRHSQWSTLVYLLFSRDERVFDWHPALGSIYVVSLLVSWVLRKLIRLGELLSGPFVWVYRQGACFEPILYRSLNSFFLVIKCLFIRNKLRSTNTSF